MDKTSICRNCNRPKDGHTKKESISCAIESAKNDDGSEPTENEVMEYFNKIKSAEFFRMKASQKNKTKQDI